MKKQNVMGVTYSHQSVQSEKSIHLFNYQLKEKPYYDEQKIVKFIQQKRKQQEQLNLQSKVIQLLQKKRRQENLSKLNEDVKDIFNKKGIKSRVSEHSVQPNPKQDINPQSPDQVAYFKQQYQNLATRFQNAVSTNSTNQIEKFNINDTQLEILQFHYMNEAATMIQSFWRGYQTRKALSIYLQMIFEQQAKDVEEDEEEVIQSFIQESNELIPVENQKDKPKKQLQEEEADTLKKIESTSSDLQNQILAQIQKELQKSEQALLENVLSKNDFSSRSAEKVQEITDTIKSIHNDTSANIIMLMQQLISIKRMKTQTHSDQFQSRDIEMERNFNENRKLLNGQDEKLPDSLQKRELSEMILLKEQSIDLRLKSQQELLKEMLENKQINLEVYEQQLQTIELWASNQQNELVSERRSIESTWKKAGEAYRKIQRDLKKSHQGNSPTNLETNEELIKLQKEFNEQIQQIEVKKKKLFGSLSEKSDEIKIVDNYEVKISDSDFFNKERRFESSDHSLTEEDRLLLQNQKSQKNCVLINDNEFRPDADEKLLQDSETQFQNYQKISLITCDVLDNLLEDLCIELHEKKLLRMHHSTKQGLQTDLAAIGSYIDGVFDFVTKNCVQDFIHNINQYYGFSSIRRMKLIHGYDDYFDQSQDSSSSFLNSISFVLDENIFLQFEHFRLKQSDFNKSQSEDLLQFHHIHNKVVFDAINETLNTFRPFYYNCGIPYPWEKFGGSENLHLVVKDHLLDIFKKTKTKVLEMAGMYCGFFEMQQMIHEKNSYVSPEKQQILEEKNHQVISQQIHNSEAPLTLQIFTIQQTLERSFDQEQLQSIREERLYRMLISEIRENEFKWFNFGDDETELKMELADMIFEDLVEQLTKELTRPNVPDAILDYE